ncbi:hypothetical protein TREMEDRAFT_30963 [Tremella mesenterica DSM 1558]|uniref:uncharacterized protein n=1 Tax=Tremella mesenterica (strain ATCC 24925 / CBS 8224 / DSM 1558 / NBRC 9311 / NRRL Y-6157 / RJB 2259-6 / UBC 559-6) TaxID=578456 RepID=UPI0003F4A494|nr:uncharacterized protein TREMEDRAFT_30963 [Tremella mesenterica DSM 1558]EIW69639.1 hypothetical protein TREMEDRAFT_30963 [Tremella mesenterica DSM 1558]
MTMPQPAGPQPISFPQYLWRKCKSQPVIPIGMVATVGALVGAAYSMRTGNRRSMNYYLRARVALQGLTVVAMILYGSVAITLPSPEQIPIRLKPDEESEWYQSMRDLRTIREQHKIAKGEVDEVPERRSEQDLAAYPLRKEDRVKASEFAQRLKEAERLQKVDDEAKEK